MKQLLKQIWNERRVNSWLWAELLIVFVVLWYVVDWGYTNAVTYYEPLGFDITDTYQVTITKKTDKAADYISPENASQTGGQDMLDLVERFRRLPEVEAVSLSINAIPYCGSNSGTGWRMDSTVVWPLKRPVTPDFFRVFRYQSVDGRGYEPLMEALKRGDNVVSVNLLRNTPLADFPLINSTFYNVDDSTETYRVGAVSQKVRYDDFWANFSDKYVAMLLTEESITQMNDANPYEVCIRVNPGTTDFPARLMEMSDAQFTIGNLFISKVESFKDIRRHTLNSMFSTIKTRMWMMGFLLMNIFLGIIGTFWFRTQQRRSEIGLRMALGSSRIGLLKRLMNEGLLLLILAFIPAIIICISIVRLDMASPSQQSFTAARLIIAILITLILMGMMILLGIWYPARQAMKIEPAEALHDE